MSLRPTRSSTLKGSLKRLDFSNQITNNGRWCLASKFLNNHFWRHTVAESHFTNTLA